MHAKALVLRRSLGDLAAVAASLNGLGAWPKGRAGGCAWHPVSGWRLAVREAAALLLLFFVGYLLLPGDGPRMGVVTLGACHTRGQFGEPPIATVQNESVSRFDPCLLGRNAQVRPGGADDSKDQDPLVP